MDKIWKGRIQKKTHELVDKFTGSLDIDKDLYIYDIMGSMAHAAGLNSAGIIDDATFAKLVQGLDEVKQSIEKGPLSGFEDIHSLVESRLIEKVGEAGKKIHTGRSRNDQVVTDERLYAKQAIVQLLEGLIDLQSSLLNLAEKNINTVIPAYTHLQKAQPVLAAHYLLSFFTKFTRDLDSLAGCFKACDSLPLGAAACVGSGYKLDRKLIAKLLKFSALDYNSLDTVSSRDFMLDIIYACSKVMLHLSRISEDFIIYASQEFSYIEIDDAFCTGSSIMPQKKNPDVLELIRGKSAVVMGNLNQLMMLLKGLPMAYNRDLQEDKGILFEAVGHTAKSIEIFAALLQNMEFKPAEDKLKGSFMQATDIADYLVAKGESFRNSHNIVGRLVAYCVEKGIDFDQLTPQELQEFSPYFTDDFYQVINIESCIDSKKVDCGTSRSSVEKNIKDAGETLHAKSSLLVNLKQKLINYEQLINLIQKSFK